MMDYFTKSKFLFWCVVILAIVNAVTLTSFWMKGPLDRDIRGSGGEVDGGRIMEQRLGLTQQQSEIFEQIRTEHFGRVRPLQGQMHKIRLDLLNEIFSEDPDRARISGLLDALEQMQAQFDRNLFDHFEQLKDACSEDQVEELKIMLRNLLESTRPTEGKARRPAKHGEMRPGHRPPPRR
jgi:Spy/CpxP family protein refolding chaperone